MATNRAVKLKGKKILLSPVSKNDIALFHSWISDLEVTKTTLSSAKIFTLEDERDWFADIGRSADDKVLAIVVKNNAKVIGTIGLHKIDSTDRRASLGIMIGDKRYWGKGYGKEAVVLMLDFAFTALNLHSVHLGVFAFNHRAVRAYKTVGFKEYGRQREAHFWGGVYYDIIQMDILESEFKSSRIKELILEAQKMK